MSLGHSQRKTGRGLCGRDQHYHAAVAGHFNRVLISYSWGCCGIRKMPRFENFIIQKERCYTKDSIKNCST